MFSTHLHNLLQNEVAYEAIGGLLFVALVYNMPKPGTPFTWLTIYTWLYETLQAFLSVRSPHPPTPPVPPPPTS